MEKTLIVVDDKEMPWHDGMTVRDLLNRLEHTDFCAAIRINGKLVSSPNFDHTIIPRGAQIYLLPLIAGG